MFVFEDPTASTEAQMEFAKKIRELTRKRFPKDKSRMSMQAYISTNYPEFRRLQLDAGPRLYPDDLDWDAGAGTDGGDPMYGMDFFGIDIYTGGLAEY